MEQILGMLGSALDLLVVILGFGLIVFVHESGHFLAARWAGIRVLAFAIGFGPAVASWRKGLGFRRGSSAGEYERLKGGDGAPGASPTEYRLNALPFGGYVKMLGQEDLNPAAASAAPDSYQSARPWKRMVVISGGVVMNVLSAAALFVVVFMVGLKTEPAVVGVVYRDGPAAQAVATNAQELGITKPGLASGDRIIRIGGRSPREFNDVALAAATSRKGLPVHVLVEREGFSEPVEFEATTEVSVLTGLLDLGIEPIRSARVVEPGDESQIEQLERVLADVGLAGVRPGMRLVQAGGIDTVTGAHDLIDAVRASGGEPVHVVFEGEQGRVEGDIQPEPELQLGDADPDPKSVSTIEHLLGLTPVMAVGSVTGPDGKPTRGGRLGLEKGDVFAMLGGLEYPSLPAGIAQIRAHRGRQIDAVVLRMADDGTLKPVRLTLPVSRRNGGTIGFTPSDTARSNTLLALPPERIAALRVGAEAKIPAAASVIDEPGMRIVRVAGKAVSDLGQVREALRRATRDALEQGQDAASVDLELQSPAGNPGPSLTRTWTLDRDQLQALHELSWMSPIGPALFAPEQIELKAGNPFEALALGVGRTKQVMLTTYVTFLRLFQGSVKVKNLYGPVGIAQLGTQIAQRGLVWLLFFGAVISVNLAVINFLPIPIADGGHMVLLIIEQIRGRPVPVEIQNVATIAGLVLIGSLFLIVTYNDVARLFGL